MKFLLTVSILSVASFLFATNSQASGVLFFHHNRHHHHHHHYVVPVVNPDEPATTPTEVSTIPPVVYHRYQKNYDALPKMYYYSMATPVRTMWSNFWLK